MAANASATNETGFTALPGGIRNVYGSGTFSALHGSGYLWSATENGASHAGMPDVDYLASGLGRGYGGKEYGCSVRCLRD